METQQLQESGNGSRTHRIQPAIKWIVYALLIVNFAFYIMEDWIRSVHIVRGFSGRMMILKAT